MNLHEDKTRSRLLETAGIVFSERGFEKATIREICSRAEVNLAAVNYHFGDKAKLYQATLLHAHEVVFEQVPLPAWDETVSAQQKLRDFVKTLMHRLLLVNQLPWQSRLLMRELMAPTSALDLSIENYILPIHRLLLDVLGELLPAQASQAERIQTAFSIVGQCMFYKTNAASIRILVPEALLASEFTSEHLIDHITEFTLAAIAYKNSVPSSKALSSIEQG